MVHIKLLLVALESLKYNIVGIAPCVSNSPVDWRVRHGLPQRRLGSVDVTVLSEVFPRAASVFLATNVALCVHWGPQRALLCLGFYQVKDTERVRTSRWWWWWFLKYTAQLRSSHVAFLFNVFYESRCIPWVASPWTRASFMAYCCIISPPSGVVAAKWDRKSFKQGR